jgi:hypothetical protein
LEGKKLFRKHSRISYRFLPEDQIKGTIWKEKIYLGQENITNLTDEKY